MNSFELCRVVERESREIIEPMLEEATGGRFVYTDKGRLAQAFQKRYGDVMIQETKTGGMWTVEMKAERKKSENLFLELWSNGSRYNPGWMFHLDADLLFYHFLESDELYIVKLQPLKRWFWFGNDGRKPNVTHTPAFQRLKLVMQHRNEQMNDTWGCLAPVSLIEKEVNLKKVNPLGLLNDIAA